MNNKHVFLANQVITRMMGRISFISEQDLNPLPLKTDEEFIRNYIAQVGPYSVLCHIREGLIFEVVVMDWLDFLNNDDKSTALLQIEDDEDFEDSNYYKSNCDDDDLNEIEELDEVVEQILAQEYFSEAIEIIHDTFKFDIDTNNMVNIICDDVCVFAVQYEDTTIVLMFNDYDEYQIRTITW